MKLSLLRLNSHRFKTFAQTAILVFSIIILAPQVRSLVDNPDVLWGLSFLWILAGAVVFLLSFVCAAFVYQSISSKQLSIDKNITVQFATAFTNRLLPSGIGGMGTNMSFLIRSGHDKTAAVSLVVINNAIGFIVFSSLLLAVGALTLANIGFGRELPIILQLILGIGLIIFIGLFLTRKHLRSIVLIFASRFIASFIGLAKRPRKLLFGLLASFLIAACYIGALYCCLQAAGVDLPLRHIILVYAAGTAALAVSPTPGGLGAVEVAMIAALERLSVASPSATAVVLAYRLVSFWLPIIPGYISFRIITARRYV